MQYFIARYFIAKLMGWMLVWLQDFDGEIVLRCARPTPFGLIAYRMGYINGTCILNKDGTVTGKTPSFYCKRWVFHRKFGILQTPLNESEK